MEIAPSGPVAATRMRTFTYFVIRLTNFSNESGASRVGKTCIVRRHILRCPSTPGRLVRLPSNEPIVSDNALSHHDLPPSAHVLVVEDDADTRLLLARFLTTNGLRATGARDGREMWDALDQIPIDLVLLDVMLPGTSGLDLCRALRERSDVAIIMVTARGTETDRVLGLEFGADDYIAKPFSRPELLARIRAVLRRGGNPRSATDPGRRYIEFEGLRLDMSRRELTAPDRGTIDLSGAEYDVLLAFLEHPQRVLTRDQILELSRTRAGHTFDRSVDVLVSRLRRKIERENSGPTLIKTVRGAGLFVPEVLRR
jgi:two-component system OmpR family response regulator